MEKIISKTGSRKRIHLIRGYGVLKDYFAMADLSLYGENLISREGPMHNFIEATEGGHLFQIPPSYGQFGLKQLSELGVISQFRDFPSLLEGMVEYAKNFTPSMRETHSAKRAGHLEDTRQRYMPVLAAIIENMLGLKTQIPDTDLEIYENDTGNRKFRRIIHPETRWKPEKTDRTGKRVYIVNGKIRHRKAKAAF